MLGSPRDGEEGTGFFSFTHEEDGLTLIMVTLTPTLSLSLTPTLTLALALTLTLSLSLSLSLSLTLTRTTAPTRPSRSRRSSSASRVLPCGKQGPFGRPASPRQASRPRRAEAGRGGPRRADPRLVKPARHSSGRSLVGGLFHIGVLRWRRLVCYLVITPTQVRAGPVAGLRDSSGRGGRGGARPGVLPLEP